VSVPRCAVCGGPDAAGNGCEFCPAVDPTPALTEEAFARMTYYTCTVCGHVETRQALVEPPRECEHCRAHWTALVTFGELDDAEALSEDVAR
jgi:tRNA G26 N,N-dimethylase Trm1